MHVARAVGAQGSHYINDNNKAHMALYAQRISYVNACQHDTHTVGRHTRARGNGLLKQTTQKVRGHDIMERLCLKETLVCINVMKQVSSSTDRPCVNPKITPVEEVLQKQGQVISGRGRVARFPIWKTV